MMYYFNIMLILSVLAGDLSNFFQFSRKHFFNDNEHSSTTEEGSCVLRFPNYDMFLHFKLFNSNY